ncbi:MAG TPA: hypothetical protein VHL60_00495 [Oxalicibacterium sp.]|nr:hypothetical protein [Oxalicibacterium sp.]
MAAAAATAEAPAEKPLPPPRFPAYTAEAASPRSAIPPERPAPSPNPARADFGIAGHQENFESAALRPPRISSFELKAGLAVLVLFVGGGLYWWSSQNDSRLAELAMTARSPTPSVIQPVADNSTTRSAPSMPDSTKDTSYLAATSAAPVAVPPVATPDPAPPAPVTEAAPKTKSGKHKNARKRRSEPEARQPETVIPEPEPQVAQAAPLPVEKHRPSTREQVASCKRMSLFDGERCLWRICDGRWGKDGCPSYN